MRTAEGRDPKPAARPARLTPVLPLMPRRAPQRSWRIAASAIAAGLLLVAAGTAGHRAWQQSRRSPVAEAPMREFATTRGQRATVRLADGTRVELGFASRLRVRPFDRGRREMYLEGEAVFDVVHDSTRPFLVHAGNAVTEDLGTVFAVRAYQGDEAVRVVVVEGKVALRPAADTSPAAGRPDSALLGPGQLGRLDAAGRLEVQRGVDAESYVAWLGGRIVFHDARLETVAADLSRRFDVPIRIAAPAASRRRVTVDMAARPLGEVLDAVVVPLGLRHRRDGGGIVIGK